MFNFTKGEYDQSIFLFDHKKWQSFFIMLYTMADLCFFSPFFFFIYISEKALSHPGHLKLGELSESNWTGSWFWKVFFLSVQFSVHQEPVQMPFTHLSKIILQDILDLWVYHSTKIYCLGKI